MLPLFITLFASIYNEQELKLFAGSAILAALIWDRQVYIQASSVYGLRITLLGGREIWVHLTCLILEKRQQILLPELLNSEKDSVEICPHASFEVAVEEEV